MDHQSDDEKNAVSNVPWMTLRFCVAIILIASAFLKLQSFGSQHSVFAELVPQLEWLAIQGEFLIGIWLLTGWWSRASWSACVFLFCVFTGASLSLLLQGRSSCGCLGAVDGHPAWMAFFDVAILVLLFYFRPFRETNSAFGRTDMSCDDPKPTLDFAAFKWVFTLSCVAIVFAGFIVVDRASFVRNEINRIVPASWTGQWLVTDPSIVDAGGGYPDTWKSITLTILNRDSKPITIIGSIWVYCGFVMILW